MKVKINECLIEIDQRKVSKLIRYPDGINRILTLTGSQWAAFDLAEAHGYKFESVLWCAIELSSFRQGDSLPGQDINSCTWFMLGTMLGRIQEERAPVSNDNCPVAAFEARR